MKKRLPISESQIDRRIEFLIAEARSDTGIRDQVVSMALRVVTNWIAVGDDVSSEDLKRRSRYRSEKAHALFSEVDFRSWCSSTINEHRLPLKRSWLWMRDNAAILTKDAVKDHLRQWPVVVVTKEENALLNADLEPVERYRAATIMVLERQADGGWIPELGI